MRTDAIRAHNNILVTFLTVEYLVFHRIWDIQTNDVYWSDEVYKIYEREQGETVKFEDAFLPIIDEHKLKVQEAIAETIASKRGRSISYAIRKKDGDLRYVNLHTDIGLTKEKEVGSISGTMSSG